MHKNMIVGVAAVCASASFAMAQPISAYDAAVFAGGNITFHSTTISGGAVVANGNVLHDGGSLDFDSMYVGGSYTQTGASSPHSTGDLVVGGDIIDIGFASAEIGGNIDCGGNLTCIPSSLRVYGDVTVAGNFKQTFSITQIDGNVRVGGDVELACDVLGDLSYGGTLNMGPFASVGGSTTHGGLVVPKAYVPLMLGPGRNLTAGTTNIVVPTFDDISLAPGVYGTLTMGNATSVTLTAGQYVFADIVSTFSLNRLNFDTTGGEISIFFAGDIELDLMQQVNGVDLYAIETPDSSVIHKILLESAGSITLGSDFYGTVLAPNGNITLDTFTDVTGRVLAGGDVSIYAGDVTAVPEPATIGLLGLGLPVLLKRRRQMSV